MSFISVVVRQAVDGAPGFIEDDEFEVSVAVDKISLFNQGVDDRGDDVTFVRMICGATLCVVENYRDFAKMIVSAK